MNWIKKILGTADNVKEEDVVELILEDSYYLDKLDLRKKWKKQLNDEEIVIKLLEKKFFILESVSDNLKNKESVVSVAVKENGSAIKCAGKKMKDNKNIALIAVKNNGYALAMISERLRDDEDVVMLAVKEYGSALNYVSSRLKKNKEVVLSAVKKDGMALMYAAKELRQDTDVLKVAIKSKKEAFSHAKPLEEDYLDIAFYAIDNLNLNIITQMSYEHLQSDKLIEILKYYKEVGLLQKVYNDYLLCEELALLYNKVMINPQISKIIKEKLSYELNDFAKSKNEVLEKIMLYIEEDQLNEIMEKTVSIKKTKGLKF